MPSFDDARLLILQNVAPVGVESVPLLDSLHRVIAKDFAAPWEMPRYDNSAMDGFAVRTADCINGTRLSIVGYLPAGIATTSPLEPHTAVRIMTGAPIPLGCDAVLRLEDAKEAQGTIRAIAPVQRAQHIRCAGEDVKRGQVIIRTGTVARPTEISVLASFNQATVSVYRKPRVAIVSTGDELLELGQPLAPGKIINSNSIALASAVTDAGAIPVIVGIATDDIESHRKLFLEGLIADALITSAGVSAGDRDLVRPVLEQIGVTEIFRGVDVRPGSPTAFGLKDGTPVFCLPGNPVAALLMFEVLVRPALLKMSGHRRVLREPLKARLRDDVRKKPGKARLVRVQLTRENNELVAFSSGDQSTGMLSTLVNADGIAFLAAERGNYLSGESVDVFPLSDALSLKELS